MKFMNTIKVIIIIVYILLISIVALTYINKYFYKKDYTVILDYTYFPIKDDGMMPLYNEGDIVLVNTKDNNYEINDVICYKYNRSYVIKSITDIDNNKYITTGINDKISHSITYNDIIGKVKINFKNMYNIFKILINPFIIVALLIFNYTLSYFNKNNHN